MTTATTAMKIKYISRRMEGSLLYTLYRYVSPDRVGIVRWPVLNRLSFLVFLVLWSLDIL